MCTSLMSLFGSIIDQSQDYIGFLIIYLMMVSWLYIMMQADREQV